MNIDFIFLKYEESDLHYSFKKFLYLRYFRFIFAIN